MSKEKICEMCKNTFTPNIHNQKYCNRRCKVDMLNLKARIATANKSKIKKICIFCQASFETRITTMKYCGEQCKLNAKYKKKRDSLSQKTPIKIKQCIICNKNFKTKKTEQKYCNRKCRHLSYQRNNKEHLKKIRHQHYLKNKEKKLEKAREWSRKNPHHSKAKTARRRASKLRATLKGYDREIKQIYKNCPENHHVDHIVPLKNPMICGLHVPWNLQYLPAEENLKKSNRLETNNGRP